jgi:predicted ABC-type ATPase
MAAAKARQFEIYLIYVCLELVELNLARIQQRVAAGGHGIPEEDVRRRYRRSLQNLPSAIAQADIATLCDNSGKPDSPKYVMPA